MAGYSHLQLQHTEEITLVVSLVVIAVLIQEYKYLIDTLQQLRNSKDIMGIGEDNSVSTRKEQTTQW